MSHPVCFQQISAKSKRDTEMNSKTTLALKSWGFFILTTVIFGCINLFMTNRIPLPPGHKVPQVKEAKLTRDETAFILDRCLLPQHREDPNVMRFIASYLICRSVRQAAGEAGITARDGENLKRRPDIHRAIVEVTDKAVLLHGYDAAEVVERVKEIVAIDPGDMQRDDGTFIESLRELAPETRRAIKKFKAKNIWGHDANGMRVIEGKLIEVEFFDKLKGVELLGREKNLFKETKKVEHDLSKNMSSVLLASKALAEESAAGMREVSDNAQLESRSVGEAMEAVVVGEADE